MIRFPNAKINLGLHVFKQKSNHLHELQTIILPVFFLKDALEVLPAKHDLIKVYGNIHISEPNTLVKTLQIVRKFKSIPPVEIHLLKNIPPGSGLGGGSSDAAFLLNYLKESFLQDMSEEEFLDMAADIGSDVPFFLYNKPAIIQGTGNRIRFLTGIPQRKLRAIIVYPQIEIKTASIFKQLKNYSREELYLEGLFQPVKYWKKYFINVFEEIVFTKYPELKIIKEELYARGWEYAGLTGTGSALFGLSEKTIPDKYFHPVYKIKTGIIEL